MFGTGEGRKNDEILVYGREEGCDVVFIAGPESETQWRLPAHSQILRKKNVVFDRMFSENFYEAKKEELYEVRVPDVDGKAMDTLFHCLYGEPVRINSFEIALISLYAGHKYECPELVRQCVFVLISSLKETNVLRILDHIKLFNSPFPNTMSKSDKKEQRKEKRKKSKKSRESRRRIRKDELLGPSSNNDDFGKNLESIEQSCLELFEKCLNFIDEHAVKILESDDFEKLDLSTLTLILQRDTLNVTDENSVFDAILRWAVQECKQQHLALTEGNKRQVLGSSLFLPRYCTMTLKSFENGPQKSGLFSSEETTIIRGIISKTIRKSSVKSPEIKIEFEKSASPRRPISGLSAPKSKKSQRIHIGFRKRLQFLFSRFICARNSNKCCAKGLNSEISSPSSLPSSPMGSNYSSPTRERNLNEFQPSAPNFENLAPVGRRESQTARCDFFGQMIVCFACLFD